MLNFDARVKNSDVAQPRVTNVKTPIRAGRVSQNGWPSPAPPCLQPTSKTEVGFVLGGSRNGPN